METTKTCKVARDRDQRNDRCCHGRANEFRVSSSGAAPGRLVGESILVGLWTPLKYRSLSDEADPAPGVTKVVEVVTV
jgi:hypothetical protein